MVKIHSNNKGITLSKSKNKTKTFNMPQNVAAIDIGSTSVRLRLAEIATDGKITALENLVHPVPISSDSFSKGYITPNTLRILCRVLKNFANKIKEYGITSVNAIATSALRESENTDIVVDRIRLETGIQIKVIDQVEESRLNFELLQPFLENNLKRCRKNILYIDLGGGSTETLLIKNQKVVLANSMRLGTSRLFHSIGQSEGTERKVLTQSVIRNVVNATIKHFADYKIGEYVVANINLHRLFTGQEGVKEVPGGLEIPITVFNSLVEKFSADSDRSKAERLHVSINEIELLNPAVLTMQRLFKGLKIKRFFTADIDFIQAIINDMRVDLYGMNPIIEFRDQILQSAKGLGERFDYDEDHANCVTNLAGKLYDGLKDMLGLYGKDRLYLEVAAVLHDIGMFLNDHAHHKHSQYMIEWSEIVGLNQDERKKIAMIARYHRKAHPNHSHPDYMALSTQERIRVAKLASLLRVADALDRPHRQSITDLSVKIEDNTIIITTTNISDILVEQIAVNEKGELLKDITGNDIEIRQLVI